jgi:hypothetical protein
MANLEAVELSRSAETDECVAPCAAAAAFAAFAAPPTLRLRVAMLFFPSPSRLSSFYSLSCAAAVSSSS